MRKKEEKRAWHDCTKSIKGKKMRDTRLGTYPAQQANGELGRGFCRHQQQFRMENEICSEEDK